MNNMNINGYDAIISYDPEINMFRGEFVEINGGADFYASTVNDLRKRRRDFSQGLSRNVC